MLDEFEKFYALMRKYLPELANHTDTLIGAEKEKFVKSVEPVVKRFVEQRTKNVSDIKGSFLDRINDTGSQNTVNRDVLMATKMGRAAFQNDIKKANGNYLLMDKSMPPSSLTSDELVAAWDTGYSDAESVYRMESEKNSWGKKMFWTGIQVGIGIGIGIYISRLFKGK